MFHFLNNYSHSKPVISILHKFHKPPWGGGNQFLLALKKVFENQGYKVKNKLDQNALLCIYNSFTFDLSIFNSFEKQKYNKVFMVHRVDGPTILVRGKDQDLDNKVFEINSFANATVFQSNWSLNETKRLGYKPVNPIVITNSVDSDIFNTNKRVPFNSNRKIRLISTSWSDNIRKGFECYQWLDNHLNWDKFEYTFLGRSPIKFKNIKHIPAQDSAHVSKILQEHDVYITASQNEPCSNALIEALSCGLPTLFLIDGSHPEIVKNAGLGFKKPDEIISKLEDITKNYSYFQKQISVSSIEDIAKQYLNLIKI